jgi:hypothetical protein
MLRFTGRYDLYIICELKRQIALHLNAAGDESRGRKIACLTGVLTRLNSVRWPQLCSPFLRVPAALGRHLVTR